MKNKNDDWDMLHTLVKKHRSLDNEADALNTRRFLSPKEKTKLRELKVMRLRCKDRIMKLKSELAEGADLV